MEVKLFEVRDRSTFIPVMATRLEASNKAETYLIARAGFSTNPQKIKEYVLLSTLTRSISTYDPYDWDTRTMSTAHQHIIDNYDLLEAGSVIDVEFILGETNEQKESERIEW